MKLIQLLIVILIIIVLIVALLLVRYFCLKSRKIDLPFEDDDVIEGGVVRRYNDPDAPKTIESSEIVSFSLNLHYYVDEGAIECGVHDMQAYINEGKVKGSYSFHNRCGEGSSFNFECEEAFMNELDKIIKENNLSNHNGYFHKVSGLPDMYGASLNVEYISGEKLYAYDNQSNFIEETAMEELIGLFSKQK